MYIILSRVLARSLWKKVSLYCYQKKKKITNHISGVFPEYSQQCRYCSSGCLSGRHFARWESEASWNDFALKSCLLIPREKRKKTKNNLLCKLKKITAGVTSYATAGANWDTCMQIDFTPLPCGSILALWYANMGHMRMKTVMSIIGYIWSRAVFAIGAAPFHHCGTDNAVRLPAVVCKTTDNTSRYQIPNSALLHVYSRITGTTTNSTHFQGNHLHCIDLSLGAFAAFVLDKVIYLYVGQMHSTTSLTQTRHGSPPKTHYISYICQYIPLILTPQLCVQPFVRCL